MRRQSVLQLFFVAVTAAVVLWPHCVGLAQAQNPISLGQQGAQAGNAREAVHHYTLALQTLKDGSEEELKLREKIIDLVRGLDPKPAIPEEAERHFVRGGILSKEARNVADYAKAARELREALKVAPWWGDAYVNYALVQEHAKNPGEAIRSLKLYLRANPNAVDSPRVRQKIYGLEFSAEKVTMQQRFEGKWKMSVSPLYFSEVVFNAQVLEQKLTMTSPIITTRDGVTGRYVLEAQLNGDEFYGKLIAPVLDTILIERCFGATPAEWSVAGRLTSDGKTIEYVKEGIERGWFQKKMGDPIECRNKPVKENASFVRVE